MVSIEGILNKYRVRLLCRASGIRSQALGECFVLGSCFCLEVLNA